MFIESKFSVFYVTGDDLRNAESLVEAVIAFQEQQNTESHQSCTAATFMTAAASNSGAIFVPTAAVLPPIADAAYAIAPEADNSSPAKGNTPRTVFVYQTLPCFSNCLECNWY